MPHPSSGQKTLSWGQERCGSHNTSQTEYATDEKAKLRPSSPETSQAGSGLRKGVMWQLERKDKRSMVKNCLKKMIQTVETRLGSWETRGKDSSSGSSKELRQQPAHPTLCVHSLSMRMAL